MELACNVMSDPVNYSLNPDSHRPLIFDLSCHLASKWFITLYD